MVIINTGFHYKQILVIDKLYILQRVLVCSYVVDDTIQACISILFHVPTMMKSANDRMLIIHHFTHVKLPVGQEPMCLLSQSVLSTIAVTPSLRESELKGYSFLQLL